MAAKTDTPYNQIHRSQTNKILGGVAGGLGEYFQIDPTIIRIIFVLLTIFGGSGLLIYIVLWILLPSEDRVGSFTKDHLRENIDDVKEKARSFAHDIRNSNSSGIESVQRKNWLAVIVILLGTVFLLDNFGFGSFFDIGKLWPIILIVLGLSIILRKR